MQLFVTFNYFIQSEIDSSIGLVVQSPERQHNIEPGSVTEGWNQNVFCNSAYCYTINKNLYQQICFVNAVTHCP